MQTLYRSVVLALLSLQLIGTLVVLLALLASGAEARRLIAAGSGLLICAALLLAYWRGWEGARLANVLAVTLLSAFGLPEEFVFRSVSLVALVPPALALILAPPAWILGSAAAFLAILLVRGSGQGVYTDPQTVAFYWLITASMFLSRLIADIAGRDAQAQARRAEAALEQSEQQARTLAHQSDKLAQQNAGQQQLLELVSILETPVVSLADGVMLAPIVGRLDGRRAQALMARLLDAASARRTLLVVLDIAGVAGVDADVAQALVRCVRALRLLGCDVTITGISASVAMAFTGLGIAFHDVATAPSPQEALALYMSRGEKG